VVITSTLPADAFAEFDNVVRIVADYDELDVDALLASLASQPL
jgi:beta-phosphoglucomutase